MAGLVPGPYLGAVERHDRDHVESGEECVHRGRLAEIQDDQGASEAGGPGHHGKEPGKKRRGDDEVRYGTRGTDPAILLLRDGPGDPGGARGSVKESDRRGEDEGEHEASEVVPELGPETVALRDHLVHDLVEAHTRADGEERGREENGEEECRVFSKSYRIRSDVQTRERRAERQDGHGELTQFRAAEMHPRLRSIRIDVDRRCGVLGVGSPHQCPVTIRPYLGLRSVWSGETRAAVSAFLCLAV